MEIEREREADTFHFLWPEKILYDIQESGLSALLNALLWFFSSTQARVALGSFPWPFHICVQWPEVTAAVFVHVFWFSTWLRGASTPPPTKIHHFNNQCFPSIHDYRSYGIDQPLYRAASSSAQTQLLLPPIATSRSYVIIEETVRCHLSTPVSLRCSFLIDVSRISKNGNIWLQFVLVLLCHTQPLPLTPRHP